MGGSTSKPVAPPSPPPQQRYYYHVARTPSPPPRPAPPAFVPAPVSRVVPAPVPRVVPAPAPRPAPAFVPAPTLAVVTVTHDIQDYVVDKVDPLMASMPVLIGIPGNARCNRHILRVCHNYNQKRYICLKNCHRFHVCLGWINGKCDGKECDLEHSFNSNHNNILIAPLIGRRFSQDDLLEQLKNNIEFSKRSRSKYEKDSTTICSFNILNRCSRPQCNQLHHIREKMCWEVQDGNWVGFTKDQSQLLENLYCDPNETKATLPIQENSSGHKSNTMMHLKKIFGNAGSSVTVNFEKMRLYSTNGSVHRVRRLSTSSDILNNLGPNTRWLWYKKQNSQWHFMRHGLSEKFYEISLSDYIERQIQNGDSEINFGHGCKIDFDKMIIKDGNGDMVDELCRRPAEIVLANSKIKKETHFKEVWTEVPSNVLYTTDALSPNSHEYSFIHGMIQATMNANITSIERIQNQFLWKAYQLKKKKMLHSFNGDASLLKEQYLFHGTKDQVLDQIFKGNLDWRLYGSNVGCVYGKGTYFANTASISDGYSSGGTKVILVTMVLVGEAVVGNGTMELPPESPKTKRPYDSTVNSALNASIFVKYNHDEYYPAYAVHYNWD